MPSTRPVRVYQEDWWPFQTLPAALRAFTEATGIATELSWDKVGVGSIETMFEHMTHSFTDDDPPFDLICTDEIMLRRFAAEGRVHVLNERMARDGITLDDVTASTRAAVTLDGQVIGLPCVNVSSMLLIRKDLLDRHELPVPQDWEQLQTVATRLMKAERAREPRDFWGFATRGAPGGGHAVWTISSFLASFGGRWIGPDGTVTAATDAATDALACYLDLLRAAAPPEQNRISFVEMLKGYRAGRFGIIMDVGMEYAHLLADDPALAARSRVALIPAGPKGRFCNLYSPPWAIPERSKVKDEAWALAKFLTSPDQLLEDGLRSNAVECSALGVLYGAKFDRHFRADLLGTVRASRAIAREERPWSTLGIEACAVVGDAVAAMLEGAHDPRATAERIQKGLEGLR